MTKVKVGMDDPSSVEFVERRRAGLDRQVFLCQKTGPIFMKAETFSANASLPPHLCRYLQRVVSHPSLLQDPDVREFLEREDVGVFQTSTDLVFCNWLDSFPVPD